MTKPENIGIGKGNAPGNKKTQFKGDGGNDVVMQQISITAYLPKALCQELMSMDKRGARVSGLMWRHYAELVEDDSLQEILPALRKGEETEPRG